MFRPLVRRWIDPAPPPARRERRPGVRPRLLRLEDRVTPSVPYVSATEVIAGHRGQGVAVTGHAALLQAIPDAPLKERVRLAVRQLGPRGWVKNANPPASP